MDDLTGPHESVRVQNNEQGRLNHSAESRRRPAQHPDGQADFYKTQSFEKGYSEAWAQTGHCRDDLDLRESLPEELAPQPLVEPDGGDAGADDQQWREGDFDVEHADPC